MLMVLAAPAPPNSVPMKLINQAGAPIELFWINTYPGPKFGTIVKQTEKPVRNNSEVQINSYDTHQFKVKFLKDIPGVEVNFTKGPKEENVIISYDPDTGMSVRQTTKFNEIMDQISSATEICGDFRGAKFSECVAHEIVDEVTRITDAKSTMAKYRDLMSSRLRNYTCIDEDMETTKPIKSFDVNIDGKSLTVDSLLDSTHAKIWKVDNFITEEECGVLMEYGNPRLQRATVASEDGTSVVSENRKAQQASYPVHSKGPSDPLWSLYNRAMSLVNLHAGYNLKPEGQEDFVIIQYNPEDQYTPHCDGSCDNSKHVKTGRVATTVLYCKVAEKGGATTFTKSDIFVKPTVGMATFFSYKGPDGRMDDGYTEHSGCPVIEGEKWITTIWMRDGVDKQNVWSKYDPKGLEILMS
eukprot:gene6717-9210_t